MIATNLGNYKRSISVTTLLGILPSFEFPGLWPVKDNMGLGCALVKDNPIFSINNMIKSEKLVFYVLTCINLPVEQQKGGLFSENKKEKL